MKRVLLLFPVLLALALATTMGRAQSFDAASASAKADLDKALAELSALQQQIAGEKLPLSKKLNELQDSVLAKRKQFEKVARARGSLDMDLNTLRQEARARRDEGTYITSLLDEYLRSFETRIHISEVQRYRSVVADAKLAIEDVNITPSDKLAKQVALVKTSLKRLDDLVGGTTFEGQALSANGRLEKGKIAIIGPVALFASDQSAAAGIVELRMGSPEPSIIEIGDRYRGDIRNIVTQGKGELPLDASLGSALKIAEIRESWVEHIRKGGPVMVSILLMAFVALCVAAYKWMQLSRIQVARAQDLQAILESLHLDDKAKALAHAGSIRGPAGDMLTAAVNHAHQEPDLIEEVLYEKMLKSRPQMERLLPFLALTATAEPMLGLLGTVTGMINTFKMITVFGSGDPKLLSTGISEALITTEYGLIIAIPTLLVHAVLSRKVRGVIASMERNAVGFINGLPGKK